MPGKLKQMSLVGMFQQQKKDAARKEANPESTSPQAAPSQPPAQKKVEPKTARVEETPSTTAAPATKRDNATANAKPAFLDVDAVDEDKLPTAVTHAKLLHKIVQQEITWAEGEPVPYFFLCDAMANISAIGSRIEGTAVMTACFMSLIQAAPSALLPAVYLSLNKLAPAVEGMELGIGDSFLIKSLANSGGLTAQQIKDKYKEDGDLAEIAQYTKSKQTTLVKPRPLTIEGVYSLLKQVATASGKEVQKRRMELMSRAMGNAKPIEANFLVRSLQGKMRIGLADITVLTALAHAFLALEFELPKMTTEEVQWLANSSAARMKQAFNEMPSFDKLVPALLTGGLASLENQTLELNLPVKPMLAKAAKGINLVLKRFTDGDFTCEYKYDGERAQIHYLRNNSGRKPKINIFSRNSENHTTKYPDVIHILANGAPSAQVPKAAGEAPKAVEEASMAEEAPKAAENASMTPEEAPKAAEDPMTAEEAPTAVDEAPKAAEKAPNTAEEAPMAAGVVSMSEIVHPSVTSFILDSEVVAFDPAENKIKSFQVLQGRARKNVALDSVSIHVCIFAFDLLYLNGESLIHKPLSERRQKLHASFIETKGYFQLATGKDCTEAEDIEAFLNESIKANCEGLMIKTLNQNSEYTPSRRTFNWLKLKKDYLNNIGDSVDLYLAAAGMIDPVKGIALRFPRFIRVRPDKQPIEASTSRQIADLYRAQFQDSDEVPENNDDDDY
eukprot:gene11529-17752_t